ncbi:beta-ketoacyl-[acyl-carrier-protein] synthase family protein [Halorientalis pallida]|uniref:beta-ketoacyl-[acyl-carrier-protein] synthase family protein n=1 Tax=Halorientalis pallida TaxID=2479928 RepID=UPI003C6F85E2
MSRDVVVTGVGAVTPVGTDAPETWRSLRAGRSGAGPITRYDPADYPGEVTFACEVGDDFDERPRVDAEKMARFTQFAVAAAGEAVADAGLDPGGDDWEPFDVGVSVASTVGGLPAFEEAVESRRDRGAVPSRLPAVFQPSLAAGNVSIQFEARGPNRAPCTACASGTHAIGDAARDVRTGRADVVIAGGTDAVVTPTVMAGFESLGVLSTRTDDPAAAARPYDRDRDGVVIGEGAGVLVLEAREHATQRGATPLAEISGVGMSGDAAGVFRPHPEAAGLTAAMEGALADAGVDPAAVDHVNTHGTGTRLGDEHECQALNQVFDAVPPVTSTKSVLGHPQGGSGAVEAVATTLAIRDGTIHPTLNLNAQDPACDVPVVTEPRDCEVDAAMSIAAGFGGTNGSLLFTAPN